jgi:hypothetical protein
METVTVKQLIDAGVHFGCRVSRWNPKMAPFIYGRRNLIHIMDLRETLRGLLRAQNFLYHTAAEGQQILWVGTKRQVKGTIQDAGQRTGMPVVTERWIGGTLTNFSVIRSRLRRLEELEVPFGKLQREPRANDRCRLASRLQPHVVVLQIRARLVLSSIERRIGLDQWIQAIQRLQDGRLASLVLADQAGHIANVELVGLPY